MTSPPVGEAVVRIVSEPFSSTDALALAVATLSAVAAFGAAAAALLAYRNDKSPNVVVYLESRPNGGSVELVVRNIGKGCAYNLRMSGFDFGMSCPDLRAAAERSFIAKGIPMLAPAQERRTVISTAAYANDYLAESVNEVTVRWDKRPLRLMHHAKASFVLDYYSFANSVYVERAKGVTTIDCG